jgi:hypothetical protein
MRPPQAAYAEGKEKPATSLVGVAQPAAGPFMVGRGRRVGARAICGKPGEANQAFAYNSFPTEE